MGLSLFDPIQLFLMELNKSWTYNIQLYFNFYSTRIQLLFNSNLAHYIAFSLYLHQFFILLLMKHVLLLLFMLLSLCEYARENLMALVESKSLGKCHIINDLHGACQISVNSLSNSCQLLSTLVNRWQPLVKYLSTRCQILVKFLWL